MKILGGATQANPAILLVAMRSLQRTGPSSYGDLESRLRPKSITDNADGALRATIDVGHHVGLLAKLPDDKWSLVEKRGLGDALVSHELFRSLVRSALLERAATDIESGDTPSDVAVGLAWWCTLDPVRPVNANWDDGPERMVRDANLSEVIVNGTQWTAFRRWVVYLGFGSKMSASPRVTRLCPDPTRAVSDAMRLLPNTMTARDFLEGLNSRLSVLDGGSLSEHLSRIDVKATSKGDATIGAAFGHALDRLQIRGALELVRSDDGRSRVSYRSGGRTKTFDLVRQGVIR